jgi:hypothetical protein
MSSLQQIWRKGQNRFCLEVREWVDREVGGAGGRNGPNNLCSYKYMNKEKKVLNRHTREKKIFWLRNT